MRKDLLVYRHAVKEKKTHTCLYFILTHGVKINHIASFLGKIVRNVFVLNPNDNVCVHDQNKIRQHLCIFNKVKIFNYEIFPDSCNYKKELESQEMYCYQIIFSTKTPTYFNRIDALAYSTIHRAYLQTYHPNIIFNIDYPYRGLMYCYTNNKGDILKFIGNINYAIEII